MMTLDELQSSQINPLVAREAYEHATLRLSDTLDTKKAFEQKAFTLFGGYITVSLALLGVGGAVYRDVGFSGLSIPFIVAGAMFVAGAGFFVLALKDSKYGAIASDPDMWILRGTIDGPDTVLPMMLAYITYYHKERISESTKANDRKARLISLGIYLGVAAPLVLPIALICV